MRVSFTNLLKSESCFFSPEKSVRKPVLNLFVLLWLLYNLQASNYECYLQVLTKLDLQTIPIISIITLLITEHILNSSDFNLWEWVLFANEYFFLFIILTYLFASHGDMKTNLFRLI